MQRLERMINWESCSSLVTLALMANWLLVADLRASADDTNPAAKQVDSAAAKAVDDAKDSEPAVWQEGATVQGRVLDHLSAPVANAEVLLLGKERIIVDADRRT